MESQQRDSGRQGRSQGSQNTNDMYSIPFVEQALWALSRELDTEKFSSVVETRDHNCIAKVDSGNKASTGEERHPWRGADEEQQMLFKAVMFKPQGRCKDTDLWESKAVAQYPLRTLQWRQNSMRTSNLETVVSWLLAQPVVLDLPHAATP